MKTSTLLVGGLSLFGLWLLSQSSTPKSSALAIADTSQAVQRGVVSRDAVAQVVTQIDMTGAVGSPSRSTRSGVDFINRTFGGIKVKPAQRAVERQKAGETAQAYAERFNREIGTATAAAAASANARTLGNGVDLYALQKAQKEAAKAAEPPSPPPADVKPGTDFGAFGSIVTGARNKVQEIRISMADRRRGDVERALSDVKQATLKSLRYARSSIQQDARNKANVGSISQAQRVQQEESASTLHDAAAAEVEIFTRF